MGEPSALGQSQRAQAGDVRDQIAELRDHAAELRDQAGDLRDRAGDLRDQAGDLRDQAAEESEVGTSAVSAFDARALSARVRQEAALDRSRASQDRGAGASERTQAELDRHTAMADRSASARERVTALVDGLTGVYLRGAGIIEMERDIARARRTGEPLVLAFVDVDNLKSLNDTHGHAAGDHLLAEVANTLRAQLRSYDLIIRYGGDEFVCVLAGLNLADAADRLKSVNAALRLARGQGSVTVGLAELRPDESPDDLVARADAALYQERQAQRGTF